MIATISRVFMNEQMHWTLEATCSVCAKETSAPLLIGIPIHCLGCGIVIKIDPARTAFHRSEGAGHARESARGASWIMGPETPCECKNVVFRCGLVVDRDGRHPELTEAPPPKMPNSCWTETTSTAFTFKKSAARR